MKSFWWDEYLEKLPVTEEEEDAAAAWHRRSVLAKDLAREAVDKLKRGR